MYWPLKNTYPLFPDEPGRFGAVRRHDIHTGVDLYCELGTEVIAMEDGEVVSVEQFTGGEDSPWWNDTWAVLIRGKSGVIVYGEIGSRVKVGDWVNAGDTIGVVETSVLKKFKGRPMVMLHIELMTHDSADHLRTYGRPPKRIIEGKDHATLWWKLEDEQPEFLLDITPVLKHAAAEECKRLGENNKPEHFHLYSYSGNRFLNLPRFPKAKTKHEALIYYRNRAIQFLKFGFSWNGVYKEYDWGIEVTFKSQYNKEYSSVYVLEPNQGHLTKWFEDNPDKMFITSSECTEMVNWLNNHNYPHYILDTEYSEEYEWIKKFYGERRAKRSGVHLINHVDEGIFILQQIGASSATIDAFCLHPILQADEDLLNVDRYNWSSWRTRSVALAMEYRHIANNHLSYHSGKPKKSVLTEVNQMLIADKIQNCKDFQLHLEGRPDVPNSQRLIGYFYKEWFPELGLDYKSYKEMITKISERTGNTFISVDKEIKDYSYVLNGDSFWHKIVSVMAKKFPDFK